LTVSLRGSSTRLFHHRSFKLTLTLSASGSQLLPGLPPDPEGLEAAEAAAEALGEEEEAEEGEPRSSEALVRARAEKAFAKAKAAAKAKERKQAKGKEPAGSDDTAATAATAATGGGGGERKKKKDGTDYAPKRKVLSPDKPAKPAGPRLVKENFLRNAALDPKKYQIFTRPFKMWWEDDKDWWNAQFMSLSFDPAAEHCAVILYQDGSEESLNEADLLEIVNKGELGHGDPGQPMLQVIENEGGDEDTTDNNGAPAVTLVPIAAPPLPPKVKQKSAAVKEPPAPKSAAAAPIKKLPTIKIKVKPPADTEATKNKRSLSEMLADPLAPVRIEATTTTALAAPPQLPADPNSIVPSSASAQPDRGRKKPKRL
jgi:hypothetical protein